MLNLKIESVTVYLTAGADKIFVKTNLPCPFCEKADPSRAPLELDFQATFDTGVDYCQKVFGITPKVFDIRPAPMRFAR